VQTPWYSSDSDDFPPPAPRQKRRVLRSTLASEPRMYPVEEADPEAAESADTTPEEPPPQVSTGNDEKTDVRPITPTPIASDAPSEDTSTQPTTPASSVPTPSAKSQQTPTQPKARPVSGTVIPALPQSPIAVRRGHRDSVVSTQSKASEEPVSASQTTEPTTAEGDDAASSGETASAPAPAAPKPKPSSWASLLRPAQSASAAPSVVSGSSSVNGGLTGRGEALADALNNMNVSSDVPTKISFIQPRGLVNTGNMCYMNSVR
jgi:ubiquitin carboxyl-terminal hydrolase 10